MDIVCLAVMDMSDNQPAEDLHDMLSTTQICQSPATSNNFVSVCVNAH